MRIRAFRNGWKSSSASARTRRGPGVRDPEQARALESLRLARTELERQLAATVHERRRAQIAQAIDEIDRRMAEVSAARAVAAFTGTTTAPSTTSIASRDRSAISTGRRSRVRFDRFAGSAPRSRSIRVRMPSAAGPATLGDLLRHALGPVGLEDIPRIALVAARQPVERQPASDRGLRRLRPANTASPTVPAVYHYAPDRHELELRCEFGAGAWRSASRRRGRRARRADVDPLARSVEVRRARIPVLPARSRTCDRRGRDRRGNRRLARPRLCPPWSQQRIAALTGLDRDEDFVDAEREEPGCLLALTRGAIPARHSLG